MGIMCAFAIKDAEEAGVVCKEVVNPRACGACEGGCEWAECSNKILNVSYLLSIPTFENPVGAYSLNPGRAAYDCKLVNQEARAWFAQHVRCTID